jgi:hypothetical protein
MWMEEDVYRYLVKNSRLDIFRILDHKFEFNYNLFLFYSIKYHNFEFFKLLETIDFEFYEDFIDDIVKYGDLNCFIYCADKLYCNLESDWASFAKECKQTHILDWINNELQSN